MRKLQIGIYSGSFNPIHVGHLILANYMREFTDLDQVWFVLTPQNPLKDSAGLLNDNLRLQMVRLGLHDYGNLLVSDAELGMPKPTYTVHTLAKLTADHPECEFSLIIGGDNWNDFHRWKDHEQLLHHYQILVYPRLGYRVEIDARLAPNARLVDAPVVDISSTFIRRSIREGKNVRAFLPHRVYDFITTNGLYK